MVLVLRGLQNLHPPVQIWVLPLIETPPVKDWGFCHFKELIERIDTRLIEVEKKVDKLDDRFDKLDNRLWVFAMLILGSALTAIVKLLAFPTV